MLFGQRGFPHGRDDPVRVVADQAVPAGLHGLYPFSVLAEREARHLVPVRLLLQAARVGEDQARLRSERGEVEVAERGPWAHLSAQPVALLIDCGSSAWMERKDDR